MGRNSPESSDPKDRPQAEGDDQGRSVEPRLLVPQIPEIRAFTREADPDDLYQDDGDTQEVDDSAILEARSIAMEGELIEFVESDTPDWGYAAFDTAQDLIAALENEPDLPPRQAQLPSPTKPDVPARAGGARSARGEVVGAEGSALRERRAAPEEGARSARGEVVGAEGSALRERRAAPGKTLLEIGMALREQGNPRQALSKLEKALDAGEKPVLCLTTIGLCYRETGMTGRAISTFKDALFHEAVTRDETTVLLYELARGYEQQEEWEEALYYYRRVTKADSGFRDAAARIEGVKKVKGR